MPLDMSYESSDEEGAPPNPGAKASSGNKAPNMNDTEAFPAALGTGAAPHASQVPNGVNFASLAGKFTPPQQEEFDLTKPIKMVRKPISRISRVRDIYKSRDIVNVPLAHGWALYTDNGMIGPEKQAECVSNKCGEVQCMREFFPVWNRSERAGAVSSGSHIRLFKSDVHSSPSVLDGMLEKGGKWAIPVSKQISKDMFEELSLYILDERLGDAVVGGVYAIREHVDVLQVWTRTAPSPEHVQQMAAEIIAVLGLDARFPVEFQLHEHAFKKASKARKYFLVEPTPPGHPVEAQASALKPRSKNDTTTQKPAKKKASGKKADDFTEVSVRSKPKRGNGERSDGNEPGDEGTAGGPSTSNPFGNLTVEAEEREEKDDNLVFHKRKVKPNSRKGSKKEKKKDDFEGLPQQQGSIVPFPAFLIVVAGLVLLVAIMLWQYTQGSHSSDS